MNFYEKFDDIDVSSAVKAQHVVTTAKTPFEANGSGSITVSDADLLFSGDYARKGLDLILSKDDRKVVLEDYFRGEKRSSLNSPDGASLSSAIVDALTGHTQYAQAGGATAPVDIGQVSKLTGSATVIRNGVSIALNLGDRVYKGDVVQSGSGASLGITFIDGSVFGLSSNARMVLNEMVYDPNGSSNSALLSLVQGTISFVAGETAKKGDMKVDTPVATMGIRGTAVLVEIGFEVQGQAGAPPVKFQVLVEPGNIIGSYILVDRITGQQIGVVNQAGQVTSVSGTGAGNPPLVSQAPAQPLTPEAAAVVLQTLQTFFPTYLPPVDPSRPNANPQTNTPNGSTPPTPPPQTGPNPDDPRPINFRIGDPTPTTIEVRLQPGATPTTPAGTQPVQLVVTRFNAAPVIEIKALADTPAFNIADQVTIIDPDSVDPAFLDVAVPYVTGSGRIISVVGPSTMPAGTANAVHLDAQTRAVSYAPADLRFLRAGETVTVTIGFNTRSGPDTVAETLTYTINGANDAPTITAAVAAGAIGVAVGHAPTGGASEVAHGTISFADPDQGDVHTIRSVTYTGAGSPAGRLTLVSSADGVTGAFTWTYDISDADLQHVLAQSTNGVRIETFDVVISDGSGGFVTQTVTVALSADNANVYIGTDGNWFSPSNWSRGVAPAATDFAYFDGTTPVTLNLDGNGVSVAGFNLGAGGHIDVSAGNGPATFAVNGALVNAGTVVLAPNVTMSVQGTLQNSGAIVIDVQQSTDPYSALLINGTVVLDGSGRVTLDGAPDRIIGADASATLRNLNNTINGFGQLGAGQLNIINESAGVIAANDARGALVIDTGAGTFVNHGLIASTAVGGLEILGSLVSDGTLQASAGILRVHGAVSGHGQAIISGGTLEFDGASDAAVTFSGASRDNLILGNGALFTGTVSGFSLGDAITFGALGNVLLVDYAGGVEVHYGAGATQFFRITGNYHATDFGLSIDGNGSASLVFGAHTNQAPTLTSASLTIAEGGTVVLSASNVGVSDPDSASFTFAVSNVAHGTFQTSSDGINWTAATTFTSADLAAGHVRFVHDGGEIAPTFSIQANDGASINNLSNILAATVAFTNVNDAPMLTSASLTIAEGGTVVLSASNVGVSDPDSASFTFAVSNVAHGTFQTSSDGINWTAATTFTSADLAAGHVRFVHDGGEIAPTFSIQANDGASLHNLSNVLAATVAFTNVNDAPVATPVVLAGGTEDTQYIITSATLLAGVSDVDGPSLSIVSVSIASGRGVLIDNHNGTWTYTPAANYNGLVTFNYTASDGSLSASSIASLTLAAVNDAPIVTSASLSIAEGGAVVLSASNIGVSDPDSTSFTFTVSNVTHGRFETSANGVNWSAATSFTSADLAAGHVRFVHDGGEAAPTFSIQANDGASVNNLSNILAANVLFTNVNDAPTVTSASLTIAEGGTVVLAASNIGVSDPDSASFTFTVSNVTHGRFETSANGVNWSAATSFTSADLAAGHVRFVHDGGEAAPTFSIQANDGASLNNLSNVLAATVVFTPVNDAPIVTSASLSIAEGGAVVLSASNIGVSDPDSTSFTFTVSNVTHGRFETSANGVNWSAATSFTSADLAAGHVRFVHDGGEAAPTFSIQANDGASVNNLSNVLAASVLFTNVNDAPVFISASLSVVEGGTVVLSLANGIVIDPDSSTFTFTVSNVTHGRFETSTDGINWSAATSFTTADLTVGHVRFVHDGSEFAPTVSVQANDGSDVNNLSNVLAVTVSFTNVNDAPVGQDDARSITAGEAPISGNVLDNDTDVDTDHALLRVTSLHGDRNVGTDGFGAQSVALHSVVAAPASFTADNTYGHLEVFADGHYTYTLGYTSAQAAAVAALAAGEEAIDDFTYTVSDGQLSSDAHVQITVIGVNDAPTLTSASLTIAEGGTAVLSASNIGVSDPDSESFTFTVSNVTHGVFERSSNGSVWTSTTTFTSADLAAGHVRFVHDGGEIGPTFSIQADDGASLHNLSNVLAATVAFTNVNDAPRVAAGTTPTGSILAPIPTATGGHSTVASTILASTGLVSGLHDSGSGSYGTLALAAGDDNSSPAIGITSVFGTSGINFFGHNYTSLYVNNNGNITFNAPSGTFTPSVINAGLNNPIIAAFWADVDTRSAGHVYYDLDSVDGVMTITWDHVGYYNSHSNLLNTFQIVLISEGGGNFDIVYRYGDIHWTTGDASGGSNGLGGTAARVGYSAGDGAHYYELPQSGNQSALLSLPQTSPSVEFDVRNGDVSAHTLSTNGVINFTDPDAGDVHSVQSVTYTGTGSAVGTLTVDRTSDTAGSGTVGQFSWTYNANSSDVQTALLQSADGTRTETFNVVINDGHGGSFTQAVSVALGFSGGVQVGDAGNNTLTGSSTADIFYGQGGNDVFVFNTASAAGGTGHDVIADFAPGADHISLDYAAFNSNSFSSWLSSHAATSGNDVLIDLNYDGLHAGRDTILLKNIALASLHATDFFVASGGGGSFT